MQSSTPVDLRSIDESQVEPLTRLLRGAFAGADLDPYAENVERVRSLLESDDVEVFGAFRGDELVGSLRIHAFRMNAFGAFVPCGGLGGVAVSLGHKKRGIARDMVRWYVDRCTARGDAVLCLYPFREDFYAAMGWGLGTPVHQHRVRPRALPEGPLDGVRALEASDADEVAAFLERYALLNHGLFAPSRERIRALATASSGEEDAHGYGVFEGGSLRGLVGFVFRGRGGPEDLRHDLVVRLWCAETPVARRSLLAFLRSQADQVERVELLTFDPWFHHWLAEPESDAPRTVTLGHEVAKRVLGPMWRIVGLREFFAAVRHRQWGPGDLAVEITLAPTLARPDGDRAVVRFTDGAAEVADVPPDVELAASFADFSSMVLGVLPLERLVDAGLVEVRPAARAAALGTLFACERPPICDAYF